MMLLDELQHIVDVAPHATELIRELREELDRFTDRSSLAIELLDTLLERALTLADAMAALRKGEN